MGLKIDKVEGPQSSHRKPQDRAGEVSQGIAAAPRVYLAERLAGSDGRGIIHVYRVTGPGPIFVDGFERGDTTQWSWP